jgi:hypothetical protein
MGLWKFSGKDRIPFYPGSGFTVLVLDKRGSQLCPVMGAGISGTGHSNSGNSMLFRLSLGYFLSKYWFHINLLKPSGNFTHDQV